jgi:transposase
LDSGRLLFFDESGINLSMARRYARAAGGQRAVGFVPKNWGESVTIVAGIGLRGVIAPLVLNGSLDGVGFDAYIEQFVLPHVEPGDILVFDNLGAHKSLKAKKLIESKGASLLFLPPYSPDLNPIELAWSKLKTALRAEGARTPEALVVAVAAALNEISAENIAAWLKHCGYMQ